MAAVAGGPEAGASPDAHLHILTVLVENRFGVLARVAGLFARRGFNIYSLAVAPTEDERFSRLTIVVDVESTPLEQIRKQLDKLINVVRIDELSPTDAIQRELLLCTVRADAEVGDGVWAVVKDAGAWVLDTSAEAITVSLDAEPEVLDALEEALRPYGIVQLQRTGRIALPTL